MVVYCSELDGLSVMFCKLIFRIVQFIGSFAVFGSFLANIYWILDRGKLKLIQAMCATVCNNPGCELF